MMRVLPHAPQLWLGTGVFLSLLAAACASPSFASEGELYERPLLRGPESHVLTYPLDDVSRAVVPGEKLSCERGEATLENYRGERIRYQKPVRIHPAFRSHLFAFEELVAKLGEEHFGRAPRRILHFGAYACRPMRIRTHWISEHAFGNAIDVAGFEFGPLTAKARKVTQLSRPLQRPFSIHVDKHWNGSEKDSAQRAFLRSLADALIERPDIFRAFIGPGYPDHDNHFHLAYPPYRLVKVGEVNSWFW